MGHIFSSKPVLFIIGLALMLIAYQNCSDAEFSYDFSNSIGSSLNINDTDGDGIDNEREIEIGTDPGQFDTDGDGLSDGAEVNTYGTDPLDRDTDDGGVWDGAEVANGTNPVDDPSDDLPSGAQDNDGDGLSNDREAELGTDPNDPDSDDDTLSDGQEVNTFGTDPLDPDTDDGGVDDGTEVMNGTIPKDDPTDDREDKDSDFDGLTDPQENQLGTDPNNPDTDGDGLKDGAEVFVYETDPLDVDTDDGGISDGDEVANGTQPKDNPEDDRPLTDQDRDGLSDRDEEDLGTDPNNPDTDGDGLKDGAEVHVHNTNPLDRDTDDGGVDDGNEIAMGKDPLDPSDDLSDLDSDEDGLTDSQERHLGTDPNNPDTDGDGLRDGAEVFTHRTDPRDPDTDDGGINDGYEVNLGMDPLDPQDDRNYLDGDPDNDGLSNQKEKEIGTDPNDPDTDGDGLKDGAEVNTHQTNPLDPDTDDGGIEDGHEVMVGKDPLNPRDDIYLQGENCTAERTLGIWLDPDNTRKTRKAQFLGEISAFNGAPSMKENYGYRSWSAHPENGPTPEQGVMKVFLYQGRDGLSLSFFAGADQVQDDRWLRTEFDITTRGNRGKDYIILSDDKSEIKILRTSKRKRIYQAKLRYKDNSDGGVIGPFTKKRFQAHFSMNKTDDISSLQFVSGDGRVYNIANNGASHFIVGYKKTIKCDMTNNQNEVQIIEFPRKLSRKKSGEFVFNITKPVLTETVECFIDDIQINNCQPLSPIAYTNLAVGGHIFKVLIKDANGPIDQATYIWHIIEREPRPGPTVSCRDPNSVKTAEIPIELNAMTRTCQWNSQDNLDRRNSYLQARESQYANIELPEGAEICDLSFEFPEQDFQHDDVFFLGLDNVILASNGRFALSQNESGDLYFDWNEVRGEKFPNNYNNRSDQDYCLGADTGKGYCSWPLTEKKGKINLKFDSDIIQKISQANKTRKHQFSMAIGGDNDSSDCKHTGLSFAIKASYIVK